MRGIVTDATGLIGSAVVRELMKANHHVLGLARSDASAALLAQMGAQVQRGSGQILTNNNPTDHIALEKPKTSTSAAAEQ